MYKFINILLTLSIFSFFFVTFKYYSSNKNIEAKSYNLSNIDQLLKKRINDLPILLSDTNNVIEFNNSINDVVNDEKKRSFWNLLKNK